MRIIRSSFLLVAADGRFRLLSASSLASIRKRELVLWPYYFPPPFGFALDKSRGNHTPNIHTLLLSREFLSRQASEGVEVFVARGGDDIVGQLG